MLLEAGAEVNARNEVSSDECRCVFVVYVWYLGLCDSPFANVVPCGRLDRAVRRCAHSRGCVVCKMHFEAHPPGNLLGLCL